MRKKKNLGAEVVSILGLGVGLFLLVSLGSYHGADPLFSSSIGLETQNWCGRAGATLAAWMLQVFGLGAFLLPAGFVYLALSLIQKEAWHRVLFSFGGIAVAVVSFTVFLSNHWESWSFGGSQLLTGGIFGAWATREIVPYLNPVGTSLIAVLVFLLALVFSTPLMLAAPIGRVLRLFGLLSFTFLKWASGYLVWLLSHGMIALAQGLFQLPQYLFSLLKKALEFVKKSHQQSKTLISSSPHPVGSLLVANMEAPGLQQADSVPARVPVSPENFENLKNEEEQESIVPTKTSSAPRIIPQNEDQPQGSSKELPSSVRSQRRMKRGPWRLPTVEFLSKPPKVQSHVDRERLISNSRILQQKFLDFGIEGEVTAVRPGPVITLYEFKPGPGVKVSRIASLADDLSMALSAQSVRILAPLPGKSVVGIEIPNDQREMVFLREFLQDKDFYGARHQIPIVMGKDIGGQTVLSDLARMPHLLIAGQTGAGKSVFMNGLICSLFYRFSPEELRMILVDPKFIEFRSYQDIPHLLLPVVDDPKEASTALKWAVREMDRRYRILARLGARNLSTFNQKVEELGSDVVRDLLVAEDTDSGSSNQKTSDWMEAFDLDEKGTPRVGKLPYIVVIIDELADLMMIAKKEVEISIARIAQKARAAGIHLVIATQRPSTDVITGLIKANLPSRLSFQLASHIDSKTILDRGGAERLLGQGDMLFVPPGTSQTLRLHGAFVEDDEINKIVAFLRDQGKPLYRDEILIADEEDEGTEDNEDQDALFEDAIELIRGSGYASASYLQRHLKIGYNRAARMIESMEQKGMVGPQEGARPREVLLK